MNKQLVVRCTDNQYKIIDLVARENECSKSELVRSLINQFEERVKDYIYEDEVSGDEERVSVGS